MVTPLILTAYFKATRSSHPHLLALPVVAPTSLPEDCSFAPSSSNNSVGKGPLPTLVTYALNIPIICSNLFPGIPRPVLIPPAVQFEDVT